jgi:hypothetical protein
LKTIRVECQGESSAHIFTSFVKLDYSSFALLLA